MRNQAKAVTSLRMMGAVIVASFVAIAGPAQGAIVIDFAETGGDVVATTSGSFDSTGLTAFAPGSFGAGVNPGLAVFDSTSSGGETYSGITGPATFGALGFSFASGVGDFFGLFGTAGQVRLSTNYVSGSPISATTTFTGQTFGSLGLSAGTYTYLAPNDTITINVGGTAAVPEASTWAMMLVGFGAMGFAMRRRRTARTAVSYS